MKHVFAILFRLNSSVKRRSGEATQLLQRLFRNADVVTSEPHPYYMHNVQTLAPPIAQPINSSLHENGSRLLAVTVMIALEAPVSHLGSIKARNFTRGVNGCGTFTYSASCKPLILILCGFR